MRRCTCALLLWLAAVAGSARADLTGSYAGQLARPRAGDTSAATAVLRERAGALSGTIVLESADPALSGAYVVRGRHGRNHVRLRGRTPGGATLLLRAAAAPDAITGTVRLRLDSAHARARLSLARVAAGPDGSSCDAVFADAEEFFTTEVMARVLAPICGACHGPGGQAAATRLRVVAGDPATTAHATFALIDHASAGDSLLLAKPLGRLPHGGGQQIGAGSRAAEALAAWAELVALAACDESDIRCTDGGDVNGFCPGG